MRKINEFFFGQEEFENEMWFFYGLFIVAPIIGCFGILGSL